MEELEKKGLRRAAAENDVDSNWEEGEGINLGEDVFEPEEGGGMTEDLGEEDANTEESEGVDGNFTEVDADSTGESTEASEAPAENIDGEEEALEEEAETSLPEDDIDEVDELTASMYDDSGKLHLEQPDPAELRRTRKQEAEELRNKVAISSEARWRGVAVASRSKRREMYSDGDVIPIGDSLQYESHGQAQRNEFLALVESQRAGKVLTGRITGTSTIDGRINAVVKLKRDGSYDHTQFFRIFIPRELLLRKRPSDEEYEANHTPEEIERWQRRQVNQRVLSEIDFIVRSIDEEAQVAIADRISAMNRQMSDWYFTKRRNGEYMIDKGTKLEARVVAANHNAMIVEVRGKEYRLEARDISYHRITDVSEEYPVGSTLPVVVTEINRERVRGGTYQLSAKVSAKLAAQDMRKKVFEMYQIRSLVSAMVTGIDTNGVYCRIEDGSGVMDILCNFSDGWWGTPVIGEMVLVRIEKKEIRDGEYRIYGTIVHSLHGKH